MQSLSVQELIDQALRERAERDLLRTRRALEPVDAVHVRLDGRTLVNFASNNYLGLTDHPRIRDALVRCLEQTGAGSGAAGLISGYTTVHADAEAALARRKGMEAAVLMPSGYQANVAAVQTFAALGERAPGGVRFLIDKLAHASLIDAVRAVDAPFRVFPHNHLGKLERLLREAQAGQVQVVLTESIFSMDGDAADLPGLAELRQRYGFQLLLDEAHASGVWGPGGAGLAAEMGLADAVDVSIVTCSKAMGLAGGAVCATRAFRDLLLQHGRAYIYSTSVPPFLAAGVIAALQVMRDEPDRQARVRELAGRVRQALAAGGMRVEGQAESPILPIVLGSEAAALDAARRLEAEGLLVIAMRPPTVPRGSSRLRITVSSAHSDAEIDHLIRGVLSCCGSR